jgi:hypothetical protein
VSDPLFATSGHSPRATGIINDEPVWHDGKVVGCITSGSYGHCVGRSLAMGYMPASIASAPSGFEIEILGERRSASIAPRPIHDPAGGRMRSQADLSTALGWCSVVRVRTYFGTSSDSTTRSST